MYPAHFFSLFPPFPHDDVVFVAMSFDAQFNSRWEHVIKPAIARVMVKKGDSSAVALTAVRVDQKKISDSILTEILMGITRCRLFLADITTMGMLDTTPIRNANVMYEVGIAHAVRLPLEVVLFRSDSDRILFDVQGVRVNFYDPDVHPGDATEAVASALRDAINEVELAQHLTVQRLADGLDHHSFMLLADAVRADGTVPAPQLATMGELLSSVHRVQAIPRLLEKGLLTAVFPKSRPDSSAANPNEPGNEVLKYRITPLGFAVTKAVVLGASPHLSPEVANAILEAPISR